MRVVHILRKYDPAEWGGTETAIHQLVDGLAVHGVTSAVYAPQLRSGAAAGLKDPLAESGSEVRRFRAWLPMVGISPSRRAQMVAVGGNLVSLDLLRDLWRERSASVIHSHVFGRLGAMGLRVARRRRIPFVASVHGGLYDVPATMKRGWTESGRGGLDWGKAFGLMLGARGMVGESDAVVTCNPVEAKLISERHPGLRVMVQPHGVPAARYAVDHRAEALEAFPILRGRRLLLMPGRVDPVKNQDWVAAQTAKLVRRHPDLAVVSVGPCTDAAYGDQLHARIDQDNLDTSFFAVGKLPPGDPRLVGLMQLAEAVVLPSISETFGLVILEAWAAGTPTISSRTSGAVSVIKPGHNGWLFDLERPESFHRAVDELLADRGRRDAYGERGRAVVRAEYDSAVLAGRMRRLYEELSTSQLPCAT